MTTPQQFFKAHPTLPKWLTGHKLFKEVKEIHKVFPGIGLPNSTEDFILNNDTEILNAGKALIFALNQNFIKRKTGLNNFLGKDPKIGTARKQSLNDLLSILDTLSLQAKTPTDLLSRSNTGKLNLNLSSDVLAQNKTLFKKGEGLFKAYGKVNKLLIENKFKALKEPEALYEFKQFSSINIPTKKSFSIVFSSTGTDGLWDIATMSMRGVASCQSWNGDYHRCLIGSILDPFVGIIYVASKDKTEYGSKMTRRCVVRFAVNEETRKPSIVIDKMYPTPDKSVVDAFIQFIRQKTKNKLNVYYVDDDYPEFGDISFTHKLYMPLTELREKIGNLDLNKIKDGTIKKDPDNYYYYDDESGDIETAREAQYTGTASYQDTFIPSKTSTPKDKHAILFEKNAEKKTSKFKASFKKALKLSVSELDIAHLPSSIQSAIKKLSGNTKDIQINPKQVVKHVAELIAKDVIESVNKKDFMSSDAYIQRVYQNYFIRKQAIFDGVKTKLTREMNGKLKLKNKLNGKQTIAMLNSLSSKIDAHLKDRLKKIVAKRKEKSSGALPLPG